MALSLLAQEVFPLRLVHLAFDFGLDLVGELQDLDFLVQQGDHLVDPGPDIEGFEEILLLFRRDAQVGGDDVGQTARFVNGVAPGRWLRSGSQAIDR